MKKLIALISTEGKTGEQIDKEAMEAIAKFNTTYKGVKTPSKKANNKK